MRKAPTVRNHHGYCLLRFSYAGSRNSLILGRYDDAKARAEAELVASRIWLDIQNNCFDTSLARYKRTNEAISIVSALSNRSNPADRALLNLLNLYGKSVADASSMSTFFAWLTQRALKPASIHRYYDSLHAIDAKLTEQIKLPKLIRRSPMPFTRSETNSILEVFRQHQHYGFYYDYVFTLLNTGLRTAEAIGLRRCDVSFDAEQPYLRISSALARKGNSSIERVRKEPKNGKARTIPLNKQMLAMLERRCADLASNELVFRSKTGILLNDRDFRRRAWIKCLQIAEVGYRPPYNCRHTFISNCLASGIPVVAVAQWAGNSPEVIWRHYANVVQAYDVPELEA